MVWLTSSQDRHLEHFFRFSSQIKLHNHNHESLLPVYILSNISIRSHEQTQSISSDSAAQPIGSHPTCARIASIPICTSAPRHAGVNRGAEFRVSTARFCCTSSRHGFLVFCCMSAGRLQDPAMPVFDSAKSREGGGSCDSKRVDQLY